MAFQLAPAVIVNGYYPSTSAASFMFSDHSRGDIDVSYDRLEKSIQLANGLTRKYVISTKKSISLSWDNLPSSASATVDKGAGAYELQKFYDNNFNNSITVTTFTDQGSGTPLYSGLALPGTSASPYPILSAMPSAAGVSWTAFIDSFSCNVNKRFYGGGTVARGKYDLWNVSITLKEA
jgi:hypothetical protein